MDEEQRAAHDERMASYAATTAVAHSQQAIAQSHTAATELSGRRFEAERADARRHADVFDALAMNRALRVAELSNAFSASSTHRNGEKNV
ncbi:hypothetical protein [Herbiconiux sp. UC225_62]|uniref:hypothetical protein n=1 Tax=Herbiconiux sp. UC225_62 TaxID=3350168 RepID=UPI0036D2D7DB